MADEPMHEGGPAQDESHNGGQGRNQQGEMPWVSSNVMEHWISWHAVATLALTGLIAILWALLLDMRTDIKFLNSEIIRQNGVDLQHRQQIDINTGRLSRLEDALFNHRADMEHFKAALDYWEHTFADERKPSRR